MRELGVSPALEGGDGRASGGGGLKVSGFLIEADRNMSCHGGEKLFDSDLGLESYGTSSIPIVLFTKIKNPQRKRKEKRRGTRGRKK